MWLGLGGGGPGLPGAQRGVAGEIGVPGRRLRVHLIGARRARDRWGRRLGSPGGYGTRA
jgi:hypothetical protein